MARIIGTTGSAPAAPRHKRPRLRKPPNPNPPPGISSSGGDRPATRAQDFARANRYKRTSAYVRDVQAARGPGAPLRDQQYFKTHVRVPQASGTSPASSRTRRRPRRPVGTADQPRTNAEIKSFLQTGIRPRSIAIHTPAPAFRTGHAFGVEGKPFGVQQNRQVELSRTIDARLPDSPHIPEIPVKDSYSPREIRSITKAYRTAAAKAGVRNFEELYHTGSQRQRRQMRTVGAIINDQRARSAARISQVTGIQPGRAQAKPIIDYRGPLKKAEAGILGFAALHSMIPNTDASLVDVAKRVGQTATIPFELQQAAVEDPAGVARSSIRTGIESVAGIPQGVKSIIGQVEQHGLKQGVKTSLAAMAKDYEQRYGPIYSDPAKFRRQVEHQYGLTPFVMDAASLGVPVGRAASALAASGPAGRAAAALTRLGGETGVAGHIADAANLAHRVARAPRDARRVAQLRTQLEHASREGDTTEQSRLTTALRHAEANMRHTRRRALRFSGGEGGVRAQETSRNLIHGLGQRAIDETRARAFTRRAGRAGLEEGPGGRLLRVRGRRVQRMTALRPGEHEVVPKTTGIAGRSLRELPGLRRYTGRVARDVGGRQSVTRLQMLTHRGRVQREINHHLNELTRPERDGMKYMLQLGATPDANGIRILEHRLNQIADARQGRNFDVAPILENTNDEAVLIDRILRNPHEYLTPRARQVADELRGIQKRESGKDPELTRDQALIRQVTPQGKALGVERAPDAEFFRSVLQDLQQERRDASGRVIRPETPGLAQHADELATMHPSERGRRANQMRRDAARQVRGEERRVSTAERRVAVARARVRTLDDRGTPLDTPEVRAARKELASAKRARRSLARRLPKSERRAGAVLGRLSERERIGPPASTPEVRAARNATSVAQDHVHALERQLQREEEKASRLQGVTEGRHAAGRMTEGAGRRSVDQAAQVAQVRAELSTARSALEHHQARLREIEGAAPRLTGRALKDWFDQGGRTAGLHGKLTEAEVRVQNARDDLEAALAGAPHVPQALHDLVAQRERELHVSRATRDHVKNFAKRLRDVERAAKRRDTMRLEDADTFAGKVHEAAQAAGLTEPAYWWSAMFPDEMPSLAATGRGFNAAHRSHAYKGTLFDLGAEHHEIDRFTAGVDRNIKRRFQQALVARNLETHAYEWSRGSHGEGLTITQLKAHMRDHAIDPTSVEFVSPRILRKRATEMQGVERGQVIPEERALSTDPADFVRTSQQDLAEGRRSWAELEREDLTHQGRERYIAVPRDVGETLDGLTAKMDNPFWRGFEIVMKQKPARILLGAANVPWLAFQVASNALLTGLGGGVNPFNVWGAYKWFRGLDPEARDAVEAELGITHGHHHALDQPSLGATNNRMVAFWRAYKASRVGRIGTRINPMNVMFRADEAQNNFFRRVLFYDRARKDAYDRMGAKWKQIDTGISRAMNHVLAQPPEKMGAALARNGETFEKIAKHVNDFLGDYTRFSPAERFLLQRNVMFYGYLRFSLRFTFYTMPIAHPVMANILGNIGRLGAREIKQLMGVPADYALPTSMLAQVYFGDRGDAKAGNLRTLPLGRFNPFLNSVTQLDRPEQAFGLVSPLYQALMDQVLARSTFTGQPFRIGGRPTPSDSERPTNYFGSMFNLLNPGAYDVPGHKGRPRNRILEADLLGLAFPYRVATAAKLAPDQADDALLWRPDPMKFADPTAMAGVRHSRQQFRREGARTHIAQQVLPVFPRRTSLPAVVKREREKEAAIAARNRRPPGTRKRRRRRATGSSYSSGGGGGGYGGGSSSGSPYG